MRISVVIPAYNMEAYVEGAIRSVIAQDTPAHEVVVVDDGSTDRTVAVASAFKDVTLVRQPNRGLAAARNAGADRATGDAIFFLDSDDELLPGALGRLRDAAATIPTWSAILPNCVRRGPSGETTAWPVSPGCRSLDRSDVRTLIQRNSLSPHALIRRETWARERYREDLRSAEDLDLWLRLLLAGERLALLGEPGVLVRQDRDGSLSRDLATMRRSRRSVFASLWGRSDLTPRERGAVARGLVRTTAGVLLAPPPRRTDRSSLHVYLDDAGGGPVHVGLLTAALAARASTRTLAITPDDVRRLGPRWALAAARVVRGSRDLSIVHAHGVRAASVAVPAAIVRRRPLVITMHGLHGVRTGRQTSRAFRWILRRADRVLVLSRSDEEDLIAAGLVARSRIATVQGAVLERPAMSRSHARRDLCLDEDDLAIAWVGRLATEKDPLAFVDAFRALPAERRAVAVIAGDGPLRPELDRAAATDPRIRVLGWVEDPASVFAAADVYVNTSHWEGLPLSVLEAAMNDVPLVLTDVPGNRDLAEVGVPVALTPVGDAAALASAIASATTAPRHELADAVRARFRPDGSADSVFDVYGQLA
jgi:glycosyltransferase involved in cell wall biosynthesis/GT2 family glycosyltransferase